VSRGPDINSYLMQPPLDKCTNWTPN
jgi:hypothetical protein